MKRRDLLRKINQIAKRNDTTAEHTEGGKHTKITINGKAITVPRHNEIGEGLARTIIRQAEKASRSE